jgi:formate hydrogenlyase subunit 3/multisubunit Na+/H+ antiporter MnhD subunit
MERNKVRWQGLGIVVLGVFFIILASVLYALDYVKSYRLIVYYSLSAFLVVIGVVLIFLSTRTPPPLEAQKRRKA